MCVEGKCVEVNEECIDYTGYCFPVEGEWACQCYEPGDSRLCHDVDLSVACTDALQSCCSEEVEPECEIHEDCMDRTGLMWCILGECLPGETPCQAAGGICTLESECPDGFYSVKDPSYMNCAWCGYCCLSSGCPDLIDCPEGTTCQADGTCQVDCLDPDGCDPQPECSAPVDCLNLPWDIYCLGHWDCVDNQCQPACDMEACGDGTCDYAGGESPKSCPDDCGC